MVCSDDLLACCFREYLAQCTCREMLVCVGPRVLVRSILDIDRHFLEYIFRAYTQDYVSLSIQVGKSVEHVR